LIGRCPGRAPWLAAIAGEANGGPLGRHRMPAPAWPPKPGRPTDRQELRASRIIWRRSALTSDLDRGPRPSGLVGAWPPSYIAIRGSSGQAGFSSLHRWPWMIRP